MQVWEAVARIDSAAAWNLVMNQAISCYAAWLPDEGARELFRDGIPTTAGAFNPPAAATRVDGGWRITGRVPFASGCHQARWLAMPAAEMDDGRPKVDPATGKPKLFGTFFPRAQAEILDTWHTVGMRGTGSADVAVRDLARPEIKQPSDLKGKKAGITTFGSTSDQVLRIALKQFNLDPSKDVALLTFGAQPEAFAALMNGIVQVAALSYPLYPQAVKSGMRELVNFADLGVEDINGTVITTRAFVAQQRDTALRFMRAFTRGMQRYRTDKEFSKKVLGKYGKINDEEILEGTWQDYAPTLQKTPRPSLKAVQFMIENQFAGKKPLPKPEQFVDFSIIDQLEKSGFFDSLNR
jgi:ABC-type amino acid transport substrate-binding protein